MSHAINRLSRYVIVGGQSITNHCCRCSVRRFHVQLLKHSENLSQADGRVKFMYRKFVTEAAKGMSTFAGRDKDYIFRQLLEYKSFTYTYLLADPQTKDAILIDPVIETADRDVKLIKDLGLNLVYGVNTHVHADHITGTGKLKEAIPTCKSVIGAAGNAKADIQLKEGDKIKFGQFELEARTTPGHTNGCMSYVWHEKGMVFTGDAVLIRGCGRTDFQEGSASSLYESVHKKIFSLPPEFSLYPAHDYTGQTMSTVGEEKEFNPRLTKPKEEFVNIMKNLNLPYPKQIDKALPANLLCGVQPE